MKKNIGSIDRVIRIILVIVLAFLAYLFNFTDWKSYLFTALSFIVLATIVTKFCPIYYIFNMNSININIDSDKSKE